MRELQQQLLAVVAAVVSLGQAKFSNGWDTFKGSAYYCYCAYVLRISRYSGFPIGDAFKYSDIFARFKTIRRK